MSEAFESPLRATAADGKARQKRAQLSGFDSRRADSALKYRPRVPARKNAVEAKLAEKPEGRELTCSIPANEEAMDNAGRMKDCIAVRTKLPNSEADRKRRGGQPPKWRNPTAGTGGLDTPVTVTPGVGERVRPKVSNAVEPERGNPPAVLRVDCSTVHTEDPSSGSRRTDQIDKPVQTGGEGTATKQTLPVTREMSPQGGGYEGKNETSPEPQSHKVGKKVGEATRWEEIPWKQVYSTTYHWACRIHAAARQKKLKDVKTLQSQMARCFAARLYSVKQVCEINAGKNSPGIDGICRLTNREKWALAQSLGFAKPHSPLLRKWIPKPGKSERRPLSLPTIEDRCRSKLAALVLEPEVEASLHRDVYGFRPGRSQHDAIASVRNFTNKVRNGKFVLDADIQDFFGSVTRDFLMRSLKLPRPITDFIRSMLRAPTMDGGKPTRTTGIPQGSPLSPVLANLVLAGLHDHIEQHFRELRKTDRDLRWKAPAIIVYADDLVALHTSEEAINHTREALENFLLARGLKLHPMKTTTRHTLEGNFGKAGFDFLGFTIRSFRVGKHKKSQGQSGLQTLIQPSRKSLLRHHAQLAAILQRHRHSSIHQVVAALNRNIRAWCAYYKTENTSKAFSREDHILYKMLWGFIKRRHQKKTPAKELYALYWPSVKGRKRFRDPSGGEPLLSHADFQVEPHIKVRGELSFYNGDRIYWLTRRKRIHALTRARRKLRDRGEEADTNTVAEAAEARTAEDMWLLHRAQVLADRVTGEPDAVKAARPVLKERSDPATG